MTACNRPQCGRGTIDEQGFCTVCDREPLPPGDGPEVEQPTSERPASTGVARVRPDPWYGLALVDDDPLPDAPAADAKVDGATAADAPEDGQEEQPDIGPLAEEHRYCAAPGCPERVGRGHGGEPGRTVGFCAHCGTRFDFRKVDDLVIAGRYEVRRLLGQGSYGVAYLAYDRNLATRVVVKELRTSLQSGRERDVLKGLRHDAVVRILGHELEDGRNYLVLEYIPGTGFSALPDDRLENLLAHGVRVLQALDYLHARGLLHCDVKPLNIVRFHEVAPFGRLDRVRLIDFGAVRSVTDRTPLAEYTERYAPLAGDAEYGKTGPTPGFDLYGIGMTLKEVCRTHLTDHSAVGVRSLNLLLERATNPNGPSWRFTSARQFGEQLSGVIRQIVAAPQAGRRVARPSALFGSLTESLHGGIGEARPLGHWIRAGLDGAGPGEAAAGADGGVLTLPPPFSPPGPHAIAAALPIPLEDPDDRTVTEAATRQLAESRDALRRRDTDRAQQALARARLPEGHWLHAWFAALIALVRQDVAGAARQFTVVRAALPGELIPQISLGLCAEHAGDHVAAESYYATAFGTTPALGAAGFGLARVVFRTKGASEAVRIVDELRQEDRFAHEARVAAFRFSVAGLGPEAAVADLAHARAELETLDVDDADHAALRAELHHAEFQHHGDRLALSEAVRDLARHSLSERDYVALVDLANRLRPELDWPWRRVRARRPRPAAADAAQ
ncbi:tetratricopeptide repeat protein [Streptomyces sp. NBC_01304]|uniref:tetratricopeptide repeat protein n=1 Tax=Streptomyces sp. NBC_01304 TaxID=2903818 RepID=UPI002E115E6C|nr:protein kinase [Streptomyces sp. NBC_01304]